MTKHTLSASPLALAAILAAGALPSTAALAQEVAPDAAPTMSTPRVSTPAPEPTPPAEPTPAPAVEAPADVPPAPVADPTPAPQPTPPAAEAATEAAPAPVATPEPRRTAAARTAARSPVSSTGSSPLAPAAGAGSDSVPTPALPTGAASDAVLTPVVAPAEPVATPRADTAATPATDSETGLLLALGGLAIGGGLMAAAYAGTRRRRTDADVSDEVAIVAPSSPRVEPAIPPAWRAPVNTVPVAPASLSTRAFTVPPARQMRERSATTSVADNLPMGRIPDGPARRPLIEAQVAAAPDASNPFISEKARRKRARINLAAQARQQRTGGAPFDFRTYVPSDRAAPQSPAQPEPAPVKEPAYQY